MTGRADRPRAGESGGGFFETSPARVYFKSLEVAILELRGAPLQLSPDDWQVSKRWFSDGVPLDVAIDAIREVIEKRRDKDLEIPRRLAFYRQPVERAFARLGELSAPASRRGAPNFDLAGRLGRLASALGTALAAAGLTGAGGDLDDLVRRVADAGDGRGGDVEAVEAHLGELDARLLGRVRAALQGPLLKTFEARRRAALAGYEDRFPEPASAAVAARLEGETLRRLLGLPVLSLFAPAAAGRDGQTMSSS